MAARGRVALAAPLLIPRHASRAHPFSDALKGNTFKHEVES